jgi:transcriptional regulator with XRE-family HTH domain
MRSGISMNIGKRLRRLRQAKFLSQGDIQERSGLLRSYISRIENGIKLPTIHVLERWAKALEVDLIEVFGGDRDRRASHNDSMGVQNGPQARKLLHLFAKLREEDR